jgi:hypothetical protein
MILSALYSLMPVMHGTTPDVYKNGIIIVHSRTRFEILPQ